MICMCGSGNSSKKRKIFFIVFIHADFIFFWTKFDDVGVDRQWIMELVKKKTGYILVTSAPYIVL